jgi:type IV pilus assembly protein PilW
MKPYLPKSEQGFSLIELMIAIGLGILVVGATLAIFSTNKNTYVASENVGRIQENARAAFEIMGRELREAGGNPCSNSANPELQIATVVVLNSAASNWWSNWTNPVFGYENGALAGSAAGTDAIEVKSATGSYYTVTANNTGANTFTVNTATNDLAANDILMVCDLNQAAIFQKTSGSGATIGYAAGAGSPGNCTTNLGRPDDIPTTCSNTVSHQFPANSVISRLSSAQWYLADNGRNGGRSLYRRTVRAGVATVEEIAEGVRNMQVTYLLSGAVPTYENAATITTAGRWLDVTAVRVDLTMEGTENIGTNDQRLVRNMSTVVALRSRNP